jgi:hypothetical protein
MSGHTIKDIKNVAVKQFSINYSLFNITYAKNKLKWAIVRRKNGAISNNVFTINILVGYYQSKDLNGTSNEGPTSIINSLVLEIADRKKLAESTEYRLVFQ